jgi:spore coat-associated protein N
MQRAAVLWRANPARLLIALFALLLAGGMAAATGANFNSTSDNPANVVTAGIISHTNSKNNAAVLSVTKLMPGVSQSGSVTITNTGDAAAGSNLTAGNLSSPAGPNGGVLAGQLDVEIKRDGTQIWFGKLSSLSSVDLGAWTPGQARVFEFTVTLPDTGLGGSDNAYQGSTSSFDLHWELTS